jgi:hypothetical protein
VLFLDATSTTSKRSWRKASSLVASGDHASGWLPTFGRPRGGIGVVVTRRSSSPTMVAT